MSGALCFPDWRQQQRAEVAQPAAHGLGSSWKSIFQKGSDVAVFQATCQRKDGLTEAQKVAAGQFSLFYTSFQSTASFSALW